MLLVSSSSSSSSSSAAPPSLASLLLPHATRVLEDQPKTSAPTYPFNIASYSFKYQDCFWRTTATSGGGEGDDDDDGISSTAIQLLRKQYAYFQLCPTKSCESDSGYACGDYMIDISLYLSIADEYNSYKEAAYCSSCLENCGEYEAPEYSGSWEEEEEEEEHDDNYRHYLRALWDTSNAALNTFCAECQAKCYTSGSATSSAYVEASNFFGGCAAVNEDDAEAWREVRKAKGQTVDDNPKQYYIGPYCSPNGGRAGGGTGGTGGGGGGDQYRGEYSSSVHIAIFSDEACTTAGYEKSVELSHLTGQVSEVVVVVVW